MNIRAHYEADMAVNGQDATVTIDISVNGRTFDVDEMTVMVNGEEADESCMTRDEWRAICTAASYAVGEKLAAMD